MRKSPVVKRQSVVRSKFDSPVIILDGFVVLVVITIRFCSLEVSFYEVRLSLYRSIKVLDGLLVSTITHTNIFKTVDMATLKIDFAKVKLEFDGFIIVANSLLMISALQICIPALYLRGTVLRL